MNGPLTAEDQADLDKARADVRRLEYAMSVSWRAELRRKEQLVTARRELARLERELGGER